MIDQYIYLFLLKFILSVRLSNSLGGSDVLLFLEFIDIVFTFVLYLYQIIKSYSFAQYKEYMICLTSCSKFWDVLPAFTCARATGNLESICLGVNIFNPLPFFYFYLKYSISESFKS